MGADGAGDCAHVWRLARMVLDGKGTLFEETCGLCQALAVRPASGDYPPLGAPADNG